ncbi:MAG TPA: M20/M25/M40 family metallo-hydrolase, partial [Longimicrobiaceae bacterium]|nr:M20/M25/M40 family metallo-hydrolase [Longimicrobiaceae bacterium]
VWTKPVGTISYRAAGSMASADNLKIVVHGSQTHGAAPWGGVDPIATSAQIINGLQTIVSRQMDLTNAAAVVTIGTIDGGVRHNIIPDSVVMTGTIRALDPKMRKQLHASIRRTAELIAQSAGATATVSIEEGAPVTYNDPALAEQMMPTLKRVAGTVHTIPPLTVAEDFGIYQQTIPGLFFFLGIVPEGQDPSEAPPNHSPYFFADEAALPVGVKAMTNLAVDYLTR